MRAGFVRGITIGFLLAFPCAALAVRLAADAIPAVGGGGGSNGTAIACSGGLTVVGLASNATRREIAGIFFGPRGTPTGIGGEEAPPTPAFTELAQNFPNPFNPQTTFRFQLAGTAGVPAATRLAIYDVSGRCVAVVVDAGLVPGTYEAAWNGTDTAGRRVASGVYLARFTAGDYARTIRTVITK
jgi:hypothetical protein